MATANLNEKKLSDKAFYAVTLEVEYAKGLSSIVRKEIGDKASLELLTAVTLLSEKLHRIDVLLESAYT